MDLFPNVFVQTFNIFLWLGLFVLLQICLTFFFYNTFLRLLRIHFLYRVTDFMEDQVPCRVLTDKEGYELVFSFPTVRVWAIDIC